MTSWKKLFHLQEKHTCDTCDNTIHCFHHCATPLDRGTKQSCMSNICLSIAYIVSNSRTERPWKTEIGTEVTHVTRATLSRFKGLPTACWIHYFSTSYKNFRSTFVAYSCAQDGLVGKTCRFPTRRNTPVISLFFSLWRN